MRNSCVLSEGAFAVVPPLISNLRSNKEAMLADELAVYAYGQQAGLILWGREGEIVMLEVYDFQPGSSHRFPDVSNLCTWDELGRRDLERSKSSEG